MNAATESTEIVFSMNVEAWGKAFSEGKWPGAAWMAATGKLVPSKTTQIVSLDGEDHKLLKGAERLCEIGLLKRFAESRTKFYVPKKYAFATYEPTLKAIFASEEQL